MRENFTFFHTVQKYPFFTNYIFKYFLECRSRAIRKRKIKENFNVTEENYNEYWQCLWEKTRSLKPRFDEFKLKFKPVKRQAISKDSRYSQYINTRQ